MKKRGFFHFLCVSSGLRGMKWVWSCGENSGSFILLLLLFYFFFFFVVGSFDQDPWNWWTEGENEKKTKSKKEPFFGQLKQVGEICCCFSSSLLQREICFLQSGRRGEKEEGGRGYKIGFCYSTTKRRRRIDMRGARGLALGMKITKYSKTFPKKKVEYRYLFFSSVGTI